MKTLALLLLLAASALPAGAAVVHDESVNGDLSTNPAAPTALDFGVGGNTILGAVSNPNPVERDYITFTIDPDQVLVALNLHALAPDNLAFSALNSGATSFVPSGGTIGSFLAGIHIGGTEVGDNLMPLFVSSSVTTNSLLYPELTAGTYSFIIQQTSPITQTYELEFVIDEVVPVSQIAWGALKALRP